MLPAGEQYGPLGYAAATVSPSGAGPLSRTPPVPPSSLPLGAVEAPDPEADDPEDGEEPELDPDDPTMPPDPPLPEAEPALLEPLDAFEPLDVLPETGGLELLEQPSRRTAIEASPVPVDSKRMINFLFFERQAT